MTQRYSLATREALSGLLADLTAAINAGIVTDLESFAAPVLGGTATAGTVNAAQAARRLVALDVPAGTSSPLAPLDTIALPTTGDAASGNTLTFASVFGVTAGMSVDRPEYCAGHHGYGRRHGDRVGHAQRADPERCAGRDRHRLHPALPRRAGIADPGLAGLPDRAQRDRQQPRLSAGRRRRQVLARCGRYTAQPPAPSSTSCCAR